MKQAHICLDETLGVRYAILPGDPARLDRVAAQLESVRELAYNREFRSLTGTYKGVPVLAVSTGIGGSSAGICVEELHNIGVEAAIRIGSCGALQKGIALGDLILGCGAIRDDGASKAYVHPEYPAVADYQLLGLCVDAAKAIGCPYHVGIIHSHESFYHEENDAESAYWSRKGALGADMESAALFTIGRLRGMKTASILNNVVVYGEDTADAIGLVLSGGVLVIQEDIWGNRNILSKAGPGQTFAAAYACAPGSVLNVSVVAETPVTVLLMNVKRILNVCPSACTHHSRIIRNLLGELAEKNLRFGEKLTHMGQRTTRAKLMSYFSAEAQRLGTYEFDVPFSRQQLADYLAVERSGLSLELGKMKKDGLLDFHKSHFVLKV